MKVHGDSKPEAAFTLEEIPNRPGYVLARFYENVEPYEEMLEDLSYSGWVYDEYQLTLSYYPLLQQDIEADLERWIMMARGEDEARRPLEEKLAERDARIAELEAQNQMLTGCILELSEALYA